MDITLLKTFIEVAQTGSFGTAAERLLVTQSAVSLWIAKLEASLGRALFTGSKAGAEMTVAGSTFEQYAPNRFGLTAANAGWKGSLAASASATSGNTKNRDVSIAGRMTYGSGYGAILSALQVNSVPPMALKPRKNCSAHTKPTVTFQLTFMALPQAARQKISSAHWTQTHFWALVQASVS